MANPCSRFVKALQPFHGASAIIIPTRTARYLKWGGLKKGRNRLPLDWRKVDHNPANIPWAWIPDKWKEENTIDYEYEKELAKYIPGYESKILETEDPDYKEEPLFQFHPETKLVEGFKQALCLTKSVVYEEMPKRIQELEEIAEIPDQNERVIEIFQRAHLFDIDPKNLDFENQVKRSKQDNFKIFPSIDRYCPLILENMIRLCQFHPYSAGQLLSRIHAHDLECTTIFRRKSEINEKMMNHIVSDWLVSLRSSGATQLLTKNPLEPFATPEEVQDTVFAKMPDISPVLPIVDLKQTNIYRENISPGLAEGSPFPNLHTLFLMNLSGLTAEETFSQMTCQTFACLHSRALEKYGSEPMDLPAPICAQAVATDGQNFQFLCMQLNTTKLDSDYGVKNMVWTNAPGLDSPLGRTFSVIPMYESCSHRVWQSPGYYTGYDESVFRSFLAMWLNGAV